MKGFPYSLWTNCKTVQDFYKASAAAKTSNAKNQTKADKLEELYGENAKKQEKESVHSRLQNYQRKNADWQSEPTIKRKDRRTR